MRWRDIGFLAVAVLLIPVGTLAASCPSDGVTTTCCCCCVCECGPCDSSAAETPEEDVPAAETPQDDYASADLHFNELFPNPVGTDSENEFIELANRGSASVALAGWEIRDDKDRVFTFGEATIASGAKTSFPYSETKIPLLNGGGRLTLHDPSGEERDAVTYDVTAPEGSAYADFDGIWSWTVTPTPGTANILDEEEEGVEEVAEEVVPDEVEPEEEATEEPEPIAVILSELMPNPTGDDADGEWIELYNPAGAAADLSGWILDDGEGGSSPFVFAEGTSVSAGGYLVITRTESKLALNNDTDSVRLSDPDGTLTDSAAYADAKEGEAFARGAGSWSWAAEPTPGATNAFPAESANAGEPTPDPIAGTVQGEETEAEDIPETIPVEMAHDFPDGSEITVIGVVTVPPGVISKTIFGLQDGDTDFAMTVRIYGEDIPPITKGDIVTVTGTLTHKANGELRINTSAARVAVLGSDEIIEKTKALAELDGGSAGMAVSVQGTVTDIGSGWFIITDDDASHEIKIELPADAAHDLKSGDRVTVKGVVRTESSALALAVTGTEDMTVEIEPNGTTDGGGSAADSGTQTLAAEAGSATGLLPFLTIGAIGAGGVAYRGLRSRNGSGNRKRRQG